LAVEVSQELQDKINFRKGFIILKYMRGNYPLDTVEEILCWIKNEGKYYWELIEYHYAWRLYNDRFVRNLDGYNIYLDKETYKIFDELRKELRGKNIIEMIGGTETG